MEEHWSNDLSDECGSVSRPGILCACQGSKAFFKFMTWGVKLEVAAMKANTRLPASATILPPEISFKYCQNGLLCLLPSPDLSLTSIHSHLD